MSRSPLTHRYTILYKNLSYIMFPEVPSITEFKGNATIGKYQCILTDSIKHRILDILPQRAQGYLTRDLRLK
jgi:hypothetical protein